jgi:transcriptional regulator with XRE-family HTH domain/tetratricopeptide (TPR) repeat protein
VTPLASPTHHQQVPADSAKSRFAAELRRLRGSNRLTAQQLGDLVVCSRSRISKIENAKRFPDLDLVQRCDRVLDAEGALVRLWAEVDTERCLADGRHDARSTADPSQTGQSSVTDDDRQLRARLYHHVTEGTQHPATMTAVVDEVRFMIDGLLDDGSPGRNRLERLENQVAQLGRDALTAAPTELLGRLGLTMVDAERLSRTYSSLIDRRRLRCVIARLSVLTASALTVLGHLPAASAWYSTAGVAANASHDASLPADVSALTALLPLHQRVPEEATRIARHARKLTRGRTCLASAFAPMVEALGLAQTGQIPLARQVFDEARDAFARTDPAHRIHSIFGVSARQMLMFEGRVLTAFGDFDAAWQAHRQALRLYPEDVVGDRSLIWFDRATGLIRSGHVVDGAELVTTTLLNLPDAYRSAFFLREAQAVLDAVPVRSQNLPAVRACRSVLGDVGHRVPSSHLASSITGAP